MKKCIECGRELTPNVASLHQPSIRCRECFDAFADRVVGVLTGTLKTTKAAKGGTP